MRPAVGIHSVPTRYRDIQFRSKLEADWAEYFDFEQIRWSYEPEAFALPNGANYLPDFYLDDLQIYVECRGTLQRSLRKPAYFVKTAKVGLLIALPQGRFLLAGLYDGETGEYSSRFIDPLFDGDEAGIVSQMKTRSCLRRVEEDAVGYPSAYFANYGDSSDCYVGWEPDWTCSMKDASRPDGGDARSWYFGGMSTWQQRGFEPRMWMPRRKVH